jgi:hypothetical protein
VYIYLLIDEVGNLGHIERVMCVCTRLHCTTWFCTRTRRGSSGAWLSASATAVAACRPGLKSREFSALVVTASLAIPAIFVLRHAKTPASGLKWTEEACMQHTEHIN